MGNINYLNFRKAPTIAKITAEAQTYYSSIFPGLDIVVAPAPGYEEDGFTVAVNGKDRIEYWRESARKIGTKGPRAGDWYSWIWYLLRRHLISVYGGTCRDEFDMTEVLKMEDPCDTFKSYLKKRYSFPWNRVLANIMIAKAMGGVDPTLPVAVSHKGGKEA